MREGATVRPEPFVMPVDPALPIAQGDPVEPRINGPSIVGSTPGRPFRQLVPATGELPLRYSAKGLPAGIQLDPATGILSGSITRDGRACGDHRHQRAWHHHPHTHDRGRQGSAGPHATGLFNRGLKPYEVSVRWADLGLSGAQPVRDLWQQKDLGVFNDRYSVTVPRHGAVMVKIGEPRAPGAGSGTSVPRRP